MRNCCTAKLYEKFSYDTRGILLSDKYREVFPEVVLAPDKQNVSGWNTTKALQVTYFGAGVGGTIIGFGATLVAMSDDLFKSFDDAMSEKILDNTHSWYRGTHMSRMEVGCPQIDIGTRWSKRDVIGQNTEDGFYDEILTIPAMKEDGSSFCEAVHTTEEYQEIRTWAPKEIWMAEYMQSPIEASGTLFAKSELKRFKMSEFKADGVQSILGYIDVADEGTDRLAFPIAHVFNRKVFITDVIFTDENTDVTVPRCAEAINRLKMDYVRIESNNQGTMFMKAIRNYVDPSKVLKVTSKANKHSRILAAYGFIKEYFYFRDDYEKGSEYDKFMNQLFEYVKSGTTTKDDAPDSIAGMAKFVQSFLPHLFPQYEMA